MLLKNCRATVFMHTADGFEVYKTDNAYVYEERKIVSEDGGRACHDKTVLRIFTADEIPLKCGDEVALGICEDHEPPCDSYTITAVCDNRKCSQSHYRITAEK